MLMSTGPVNRPSARASFGRLCCLGLLWLAATLHAAGPETGASRALAGADVALVRGAAAPFSNPANLAWSPRGAVDVLLFGITADLDNNAFSYSTYRKYNGTYLDEGDKTDLLEMISEDGLILHGGASLHPIAVSFGSFAVSVSGLGSARSSVAQDIFTLLLRGNEVGREYLFKPASGRALAAADYAFSAAHAFRLAGVSGPQLAVGMNLHYLHGYLNGETRRMQARALTEFSSIRGDGSALVRHARDGDGLAVDLGLSGRLSKSWYLSLTAQNLAAQIRWVRETRATMADFNLDATNVEKILRDDVDMDEVVVHQDTTMYIPPYVTRIPVVFALGAGFERNRLRAAMAYRVGVARSALTSTVGELSFGAEYRPLAFLPLRLGLGLGGAERLLFCYGFGLQVRSFRWDWGFQQAGAVLLNRMRGWGLATNLAFRL